KSANECYVALDGHEGGESLFDNWYKSQSQGVQDRIRYLWNFIKHRRDFTKKAEIPSRLGEILIMDSIDCHARLYGRPTVLMTFWTTRFRLENPGVFGEMPDEALL